ncbi:MAG: hypothetical protein KF883_03060 [Thermomicrobiales bacterium]|nr:hypothetical protein [Thermomicrobiales bacterium]
MTHLTDFTPDDLAILNRTPTAVAMGAAYADRDGALSLAKELRAGLTAAREAAFAFPDNEVIQLLAASMQESERDEDSPSDDDDVQQEEPVEDIVEERHPALAGATAIELASQSMDIMSATATLEEAVQFKHWLYAIAEQVALATKSGGFLGIGGTQVGEGERSFLQELAEAIGMPVEDDISE